MREVQEAHAKRKIASDLVILMSQSAFSVPQAETFLRRIVANGEATELVSKKALKRFLRRLGWRTSPNRKANSSVRLITETRRSGLMSLHQHAKPVAGADQT